LAERFDYTGRLTLRLGQLGQFKEKSLLAFQEAQFEPAE
jgi:hypothetical protein